MFCIKCGQQLPDDARFCFKCGAATVQQNGVANSAQPFDDYVAAKAESFAAAGNSHAVNPFFREFDNVSDGGSGIFIVKKGDKYGYVFQKDNTFDYRIRCELDSATPFAEFDGKYAVVKYRRKEYYIDKSGSLWKWRMDNLFNEFVWDMLIDDIKSGAAKQERFVWFCALLWWLAVAVMCVFGIIVICCMIVGSIYCFIGDIEFPDGFMDKWRLWQEVCESEPVLRISIGVGLVVAIVRLFYTSSSTLVETGIYLRTNNNTK